MTSLKTIRLLMASLLIGFSFSQAWAWDTNPDANGKYDEDYDRPTYYPEWEPPSTWVNSMYYVCEVRLGDARGPRVYNYEVAVFDQNNELRYCNRVLAKDDGCIVLTIKGDEDDVFHFQVIYGDDFQNPTVVDVPDITVPFKTNSFVGSKVAPFQLILPGRTYLYEDGEDPIPTKSDVDVTVFRTIHANEWGTICLPFAISAEQMATAFGDGVTVELGDFNGCDVEYDDDDEVKSIDVKFNTATAIEKNHPYIIKVSADITEINVDGVDIDPDKAQRKIKRDWFIGNYKNGLELEEYLLFLSGGKFWYSSPDPDHPTKMMAFRAYFDFHEYLPEAEDGSAAPIMISFNGEPTGLSATATDKRETTNDYWYTLDGRSVAHGSWPMVHGQLPKGIYIHQGKKITIQ